MKFRLKGDTVSNTKKICSKGLRLIRFKKISEKGSVFIFSPNEDKGRFILTN